MRKILIFVALLSALFVPDFSPKNNQDISYLSELKSNSIIEENTNHPRISVMAPVNVDASYKSAKLSNREKKSNFTIKNGKIIKYIGKASNSKLIIPEGVTSIGDKAFEIERLRGYIYIPASVREIEEDAFSFGSVDNSSGFIVDKGNKYF